MPGMVCHARPQLFRDGPQRVEVVAEDLQGDLRAHAGKHVVETMRDRLSDVDVGGQDGKARPDVRDDRLAASARAVEIDVDLGGMHTFGMLVEFRASRAAPNRLCLGHLQDELFGDQAHAMRFGERDARPEQHRNGERALVERGQERSRQRERADYRDHDREHRRRDDERLLSERPAEQAPVAFLEHRDQTAVVLCSATGITQEVVAEDRRHRDRGDEACQ